MRHDCVAAFTFQVQFTMGLLNPVQFLLTRMARASAFGTSTPPYPASLMPPLPPSSHGSPRPWPPPPPEASPQPSRDPALQRQAAGYLHSAACGNAQADTPSQTRDPRCTTPPQGHHQLKEHQERPTPNSGHTCSGLLSRDKITRPLKRLQTSRKKLSDMRVQLRYHVTFAINNDPARNMRLYSWFGKTAPSRFTQNIKNRRKGRETLSEIPAKVVLISTDGPSQQSRKYNSSACFQWNSTCRDFSQECK